MYLLLSGSRLVYSNFFGTNFGVFSKDYIVRLKNEAVDIVFTDHKTVTAKAVVSSNLPPTTPVFDYANNRVYVDDGHAANISVGDVLQRVTRISGGAFRVANDKVVHVHVEDGTDGGFVVFEKLNYAFSVDTECWLFFKSGCLGFDSDQPITGINIIDDMLFWTDGVNEPKKINISNSILGTDSDGLIRTLLINEVQNITLASNIVVKEKHITVIKEGPSKPPTLASLNSLRPNVTPGDAYGVNFSTGFAPASLKSQGDAIFIDVTPALGSEPVLIVKGDVVLLASANSGLYPPETFHVKASVVDDPELDASGLLPSLRMEIRIMSISPETPMGTLQYVVALASDGYNLFERKFPRFACRYKYKDGEYSQIGPFSDVAFLPGNFRYHPTEAYNKGMINNLKSLELKDFIPHDIPKDVVEVDLLYKDEVSPNIYTIRTVNPTDNAWVEPGSYPGSFGSYSITTENIYAVLPSNQSLRAWDNVPKKALAQEVVGSRVVYANYWQNYDLETLPSITTTIESREWLDQGYVAKKSIKSLRTYNVGIVYGDKYGRETPVFADKDSNQIVTKASSSESNLLKTEVKSAHPSWARYYKFYVKEPSSEYYNLAMDRCYDAKDNNVWLSFPSVDRNKVDEDTYLILKKGVGGAVVEVEDKGISEPARYKIVAIENEAPDYIKTTFTTMARPSANPDTKTESVFGGAVAGNSAKVPSVGTVSFYIDIPVWTGDARDSIYHLGQPDLKELWQDKGSSELWVSFIGTISGSAIESKQYQITNVKELTGAEAVDTERAVYEVFISQPIVQDDDWIANTPNMSTWSTKYRPVIFKKEIKNKPEFDGRFFVKIENDVVAQNNLKEGLEEDVNWRVAAATNLYWLRDQDSMQYSINAGWGAMAALVGAANPNTNLSTISAAQTTNQLTGVGNSTNNAGQTGIDALYTEEAWGTALKWGGSEQVGRWFIDQTSYCGYQPLGTANASEIATNGSWCDFDSNQIYTYWRGHINGYGTIEGDFGTGRSLGQIFSDGIWSEVNASLPNGFKHRFSISYCDVDPSVGAGSESPGFEQSDWAVGDPTINSYNGNQQQFVEFLKEGSRFRFKDRPEITYTITEVFQKRLYNYRAGLPSPYYSKYTHHGNWDWGKGEMIKDWGKSNNRRLRFDITYVIDDGILDNRISNNAAIDGIDALNSGELQFLEPYSTDKEVPISRYPAIFETEPKESADLDVYYEASGKIPTSINSGDGDMLIPIGSTWRIDRQTIDDMHALLDSNGNPIYFPDTITANGWGGIANSGSFKHNLLNISPFITQSQLGVFTTQYGLILLFETPSGEIIHIKWVGVKYNTDNYIVALELEAISEIGLSWFNCWSFGNGVESNRVGDTYNKTYLTNGAKASSTLDKKYEEENRKYGMIYSGIYNSTSGVNNLNQFIAAEKITKDINPIYGSIQKLHSGWGQGGDLIALCEDRVLKILADKDALFNADGDSNVTSTNKVLGTATPYSGEYGISKNPESFASEAYRVYFTDKTRGTVMRLSTDGLTPISNHGMKDWFRDNLKLSSKIFGSYDDKKNEYNVTLLPRELQTYSFETSFKVKSTAPAMIPRIVPPPTGPPVPPPPGV